MITRARISGWLSVTVLGLAVGLGGGCGEDVAPPQPQNSANKPKAKKPRRGRRGAAAKKGELQFYPKIESYVEDDDEKENIRHKFVSRDFEPDGSGDDNRDPFRSYVIRQPGIGPQTSTQVSDEPTKVCSSKSLVASNYSLRDLRLVGIVLRGTRSYALFRDSASYGHIVRKGDCLGQEKARVAAIRAGFVSLEVLPESSPNQAPQERAIQLYPEEISVDGSQR